jgi:hypothetical protein
MSATSSISITNQTEAQTKFRNIYTCIQNQGKPTTVVDTKRGRIQLIVWESKSFINPKNPYWTPQRRCEAVTKRFQNFSDSGNLRLISHGILNRYPIICVAENKPGQGLSCIDNGLLITLEPGDNPRQVMADLFDKNRLSDGKSPITRGNKFFINVDNFLEKAVIINNSSS